MMFFPKTTAITAGVILALQMMLAFAVSGSRGKYNTWVGVGGNEVLERLTRRHANLAENSAIFLLGFALVELSGRTPGTLSILCGAFVVARLLHAAGLSRPNTNNVLRLAGGIGTYLLGFVLAGFLLWIGLTSIESVG